MLYVCVSLLVGFRGTDVETASRASGVERSTGQRFTYRRRISSVSSTDRHACRENDCRLTWDQRRRATSCRRHSSAVRPVQLLCSQQPHALHPANDQGNHHPGGPARTRTFSVPTAVPLQAVAEARQRVKEQCARGTQSPAGYVRVRSFSTSSRGVKNRGDSFKRRQQRSSSSSSSFGESNAINGNSSSTKTNGVSSASVAEMKVVVVGDVGVGKRSIVSQFTTSEYMHGTTDYSPTAPGQLTHLLTFTPLSA